MIILVVYAACITWPHNYHKITFNIKENWHDAHMHDVVQKYQYSHMVKLKGKLNLKYSWYSYKDKKITVRLH